MLLLAAMKKLCWLRLLFVLTGCTGNFDYLGSARDLPVGTTIQTSDLVMIEDTQHRHLGVRSSTIYHRCFALAWS
jgi:hypothetical protein